MGIFLTNLGFSHSCCCVLLMFCWIWYGFSHCHVRMITHKDRTFDNILSWCWYALLLQIQNNLDLFVQSPGTFWGSDKSKYWILILYTLRWFSSRGVCWPKRLGKECKFVPPCAATWWSRDPVTCLYMCMSVNYLSCMRQVTTHEVMLHHDIQWPFF